MNDYDDLLGPATARQVTTPDGKVLLTISNIKEGVPDPVVTRVGEGTGLLRFIGGASMPDATNKRAMLRFALDACGDWLTPGTVLMGAGNRVVTVTGGASVIDAEEEQLRINPMVMELPGLVQQRNPDCFTLGVVPRVGYTLAVYGRYSSLALSDDVSVSNLVNPTYRLLWVIQKDGSQRLEWDGDVNLTTTVIDTVRRRRKPAGVLAWNGGLVTSSEMRATLLHNIPLGVVEGSGRFSDDIIHWKYGRRSATSPLGRPILDEWDDDGEVSPEGVTVVRSAEQARSWLAEHGLATAA